MRILFVLEHFHPYLGGAEHLFWTLAKALVQQGHTVGVVTTRFRSDLPKRETLEGIDVHRVDCYNRYLFSVFSLPVVLRLLHRYDIVHTTSYNAALPAWVAARWRQKPAIITFHEVWGKLWWSLPYATFPERLVFYLWERLLLQLPFDYFVGVSEFTRTALIDAGVSPERVVRIYNGMEYGDFEGYSHQPPNAFTFTYFGRLGMSKGINLLMPAVARHFANYPDSRLKMIVPTYPASALNRLQQQIEQLGITGRVQLLHHLPRPRLFEEICRSSCVVVPSYSEGFCFVAAEVVALGVPIISSHQGALPEVVGGRVIRMEAQSIAALEAALEKAVLDQWEHLEVPRYLLEQAVTAYIRLYHRC